MHAALQRQQALYRGNWYRSCLREQRRTNRLLQGLVYGGLGFVLGMLAMQVLTRIRLF